MHRTLAFLAAAGAALIWLPSAAQAGDAAAGKSIFELNCSSCHGMSGKGDGPVGMALDPRPRDFSVGQFQLDANEDGKPGTDADLVKVISEGAGAFGGSPLMAPWAGILADADIENVIAYVRSFKK